MSKRFPIINPKARSVIGLYVNELVDMNHSIARIRLASTTSANLQYQLGVPLKVSIESTLAHIRHLYGDDIPDALVRTTVYLVYAENTSLKVKKTPEGKHTIMRWLDQCQIIRRYSKEEYPKLGVGYQGIAGGWLELPQNASLVEVLGIAMRFVMNNRGFRAYISLSATEGIRVQLPYGINSPREYPHIWVYDRALIFPESTSKEKLIETAQEIAAAWCPTAQAVWSPDDSVKLCDLT